MATLVSFHAHPDDEAIVCGGVMRRAADEGHRVVLAVATRGERGEVGDGVLADGELLAERREAEARAAAGELGAARVEFLGYTDSGMMGADSNHEDGVFWQADVERAAERLAELLREEAADVLTVYDDNGGYGHPDHIQVHRVGSRAGEIAGTPRVYQATHNRDAMLRGIDAMAAQGADMGADPPSAADLDGLGKPESEITAAVDVSGQLAAKRAAMRAHASQIPADSWFLALPEQAFAMTFGVEWFIRPGQGPGITESDLMAGL
jgi:LmbE family N-acetylglucosaminyl deacetylase